MSTPLFDAGDWLARAHALGRHVEVVGRSIYFGRCRAGAEAADASLFAELRQAGGVSALRPHLIRRGMRLAGPGFLVPAGRAGYGSPHPSASIRRL